jgi:hypothetical protein
LREGKTFFNKDSPTVLADVLVTVCGSASEPVFHVFAINEAEELARSEADKWYAQKKKNGEQRSPNFPLSFHLENPVIAHARDAWDILTRNLN